MVKIKPISGFPELLPAEQIAFNTALGVVKKHFENAGFVPMDTPAIERVETLMAKGGADHEIYGIHRLKAEEGEGGKDMALRFDLTVPLARFVSQNFGQLAFPFRRYQIAPVWRGERPQAGRYRQFYQCDIDVIGDGALALAHDAEMVAIIANVLKDLKVGGFVVRLNNRKILEGFLKNVGLANMEDIQEALRIVDRIEKVPAETTQKNLKELGLGAEGVMAILDFFNTSYTTNEALLALKDMKVNALFAEGVEELENVVQALRALGVAEENFKVDVSIARGLGYYTGSIYETSLTNYPELGSICSGGRYENLAGNFTTKKLPGVGISIGLSRFLIPLLEKGKWPLGKATPADVIVTVQDQKALPTYLEITQSLREMNIKTEVYLEPKKLEKQMKYANKKGFPLAVIASLEELNRGKVIVRDLATGDQQTVSQKELPDAVLSLLKR